jgi:Big-like domain-containing protein
MAPSSFPRVLLACLSLTSVLLVGCGGGGADHTVQADRPVAMAMAPSSISLTAGQSQQMKVTVTMQSGSKNDWPADALTWTSSDTSIATVDSSGMVRAAFPGSASITAVAKQATTLSARSAICAVAASTNATAQTAARLGAYYFDGWAGPLDSYHLVQLVNSPYQDRQPLSGWRDDNQCAVEQQLAWSR